MKKIASFAMLLLALSLMLLPLVCLGACNNAPERRAETEVTEEYPEDGCPDEECPDEKCPDGKCPGKDSRGKERGPVRLPKRLPAGAEPRPRPPRPRPPRLPVPPIPAPKPEPTL